MVDEVLIHAENLDENALEQIKLISNHPSFDRRIAIMPDAHAGAGCVIGFTGRFGDSVIPNIVGVDIGCGVISHNVGDIEIDFDLLDRNIRERITLGGNSRESTLSWESYVPKNISGSILSLCYSFESLDKILSDKKGRSKKLKPPSLQIGTLGGGNHFIEIDIDQITKEKYITIHSGSRNLGLKIAEHFQGMAIEYANKNNIAVPKDLEYLPMSAGGSEYVKYMHMAQTYASLNRFVMLMMVLKFIGIEYNPQRTIESVHNYIDQSSGIVRKGAISARLGESVVIPLNMADGTIIGTGKSNEEFNWSAPHGAGRVSGRKEMLRKLDSGQFSMEDYERSMEGIFTTSLSRATFDESKFAYKTFESIKSFLEKTVDIKAILKPIYNLKAS